MLRFKGIMLTSALLFSSSLFAEETLGERMLKNAQQDLLTTGVETSFSEQGNHTVEIKMETTFQARYNEISKSLFIEFFKVNNANSAYDVKKRVHITLESVELGTTNLAPMDPQNYTFTGYLIDNPKGWSNVDLTKVTSQYIEDVTEDVMDVKGKDFLMDIKTLLSLPQDTRDQMPGIKKYEITVTDAKLEKLIYDGEKYYEAK